MDDEFEQTEYSTNAAVFAGRGKYVYWDKESKTIDEEVKKGPQAVTSIAYSLRLLDIHLKPQCLCCITQFLAHHGYDVRNESIARFMSSRRTYRLFRNSNTPIFKELFI